MTCKNNDFLGDTSFTIAKRMVIPMFKVLRTASIQFAGYTGRSQPAMRYILPEIQEEEATTELPFLIFRTKICTFAVSNIMQ